MERLNDIMGRTVQRRHNPYKQPSSQEAAPHGQQPAQAPQPNPRIPLPERIPRQGQQPFATRTRKTSGQAEANSHNMRMSGESRPPITPITPQLSSRQRPMSNEPGAYQQRPRPFQESQPFQQPRPTNEYHHTDNYRPAHADVASEWEDDDDEDEITRLRYGDWEESDHEVVTYTRPADVSTQVGFSAKGMASGRTRVGAGEELHPVWGTSNGERTRVVARGGGLSPLSRKDGHSGRPQSQLPVPQAHTQEVQRYQQRTRPLNPQALAGKDQEQGPPSDIQRPTDQIVLQEQLLQYTPVAMPAPITSRNVCPICKGAGYLRVDVPFGHPNFGKPAECKCKEAEKKEKRRQQLIELSDLSAFQNKSFDNFIRFPGVHPSVQEAFREAYTFAQDPNGWLVLIGPNGCGKTHLAAAIANQNLSTGAVVLFTVVPDLLAHLRATFAPTSTEAYDSRFSKMREAELLVLDDLGAHQSSPWANEKLFQLLNYRYNSCYPTVITANTQGLASVDERIRSRLSDTALVTTVGLNGAIDYRRQNPRRNLLR